MSSILPKNELENVNFSPSLLGQKFFVRFLGELKKPKSHFEINRPLAWISISIVQTGSDGGNMKDDIIFFCRTRSSQSAAMCSAHNTRIGKISTWAKIGKKRKLLKRKMAGLAGPLGPSIKYISFFFAIFDTPSPMSSLFHTHPSLLFPILLPLPPKKSADVLYGQPPSWNCLNRFQIVFSFS